ncbi:MAG TPA: DUF3048 domain-containing protein [Acidimicrobiales bacterium]
MRRLFLLTFVLGTLSSGLVVTSALAATTTTTSVVTTSSTTTSSPPTKHVSLAPLTGLADPQQVTESRSALTIKIDNTPEAVPQAGVQDADVVYEEVVEGGITRLAAIFNSQLPMLVGPVRSVRRTDREIVFPIGGIFAYSGGAQYAVKSIETAPVKLYDESNSGPAMFRVSTRYPPHNLFANAVLLMKKDGVPRPPPALFSYTSSPKTYGPRVRSFVVGFGSGYAATYAWNPKTVSWDRSIFGSPDVSANGVRIAPKNVIVMTMHYVGGVGVIDSYAQMRGTGSVEVFTRGTVQRGTWSRGSLHQRTIYRNSSGKVIDLTPGRTWVELIDVSQHVTITSAS